MWSEAPREKEWVSWLWVGGWVLGIFALIPLARAIERAVDESVGQGLFLWGVLAAIAAGIGLGVRVMRRELASRPAARPVSSYAWLGVVGAVFIAYTWRLRGNPVEAVHFVQYGVLAVLIFRALLHRMRDPWIYLAAALLGGMVGALDEVLQWIVPLRHWDLRDIWINFVGGALLQIGIAAGLRPAVVSQPPSARGLLLTARIALAAVLLLWASLLNTPPRIARYAERVPGLGALRTNQTVMVEYGTLYEDPDIGVFRSRFPPEALRRIDAERAAEAGRVLAEYTDAEAYKQFLKLYTPISDPFLHEFRVHQFRRDRYLETAEWHPEDEGWYRRDLTVGYRENLILERYFPETLRASGVALPEERRQFIEDMQYPDLLYESRVSEGLVTRWRESHVSLGMAILLLALLALERLVAQLLRAPGSSGT